MRAHVQSLCDAASFDARPGPGGGRAVGRAGGRWGKRHGRWGGRLGRRETCWEEAGWAGGGVGAVARRARSPNSLGDCHRTTDRCKVNVWAEGHFTVFFFVFLM